MAVKVSKEEYAVVVFLITTILVGGLSSFYFGIPLLFSIIFGLFIALLATIIYWYK